MTRRRVLVVVGCAVGAMLAGAAVILQLILGSVDEYYSPGFHSWSSEVASQRGVLLKHVGAGKELEWAGGRYRVREAWVEDQQQIYYRWVFFARDSLLNRPTLIVAIEPTDSTSAPLSEALGGRWPTYDGTHEMRGTDGQRWYTRVSPPFPDSVTLTVSERVPRT